MIGLAGLNFDVRLDDARNSIRCHIIIVEDGKKDTQTKRLSLPKKEGKKITIEGIKKYT